MRKFQEEQFLRGRRRPKTRHLQRVAGGPGPSRLATGEAARNRTGREPEAAIRGVSPPTLTFLMS